MLRLDFGLAYSLGVVRVEEGLAVRVQVKYWRLW